MKISASIVTIGDEILIGQIVDTNSAMVSRRLGEIGVKTADIISIPDDREQIISRLCEELTRSEIVISTGGLGPTKDDITKEALASLFGSKGYVRHEGQEEEVRRFLHSRGLDVLDINLAQADVPVGCDVIVNHRGTAPIMVFRFDRERFGHPAVLYAMPGVPYETEAALDDVMADICNHFRTESISHSSIMVYGLAESALAKLIEPWETSLPGDMHLAYLPNTLMGVRLRLSVYGGEKNEAHARMDTEIRKLEKILGNRIYSLNDEGLEKVVGRLLKENGFTLAAAESCTGGEIAHLVTSVSGASEYFIGSVTSYSPEVKKNLLGVKAETIEEKGIVSSEVAQAMAEGVRSLLKTDFAVATTGWADAYGDSHEPAGTVWIGVSGPLGTRTERYNYKNDRKRNIERFSASALDFLRRYIIEYLNR